jgi:hypothetical protein
LAPAMGLALTATGSMFHLMCTSGS